MIRTINFVGRRGLYDLPTFLVTANEPLTIKFAGLDIRLGKYVATIRHGKEILTVYLSNAMSVDIPMRWLLETNVENPIEVFLELRDNNGTRILISSAKSHADLNGYYIEPLKLEKVDGSWSMIAWLQRIENKIQELKTETDTKLKNMDDRLMRTEETISHYENNGVPLQFKE